MSAMECATNSNNDEDRDENVESNAVRAYYVHVLTIHWIVDGRQPVIRSMHLSWRCLPHGERHMAILLLPRFAGFAGLSRRSGTKTDTVDRILRQACSS